MTRQYSKQITTIKFPTSVLCNTFMKPFASWKKKSPRNQSIDSCLNNISSEICTQKSVI